ncbi:MAG: RuBisCO large subunit C-terminal-like domain-containing protein [Candidatus Hecatellaceae archaeon]
MSQVWEKAVETLQLLRTLDGIDIDKNIIATYYVEAPDVDMVEYAESLALEQTTGTWVKAPKETYELRELRAGKVIGLYQIPPAPNVRIVQVAFPVENIGDNLPGLLSTVAGNLLGFVAESKGIATKLLDLQFPKSWLKQFKGPKFGVPGLRKLLKIPERPILNNMIKPCTGHTTDVHVELFKETAYGGVDWIKDDELLLDPPFNPFFDRLVKCMEWVDRKREEMGEETIYTINVTDNIDKLLEKAEKAVQAGANALMVNSSVGLGALRMLAEDPSIKVPIMYHPCFRFTETVAERAGIYYPLYTKLERIAGADMTLIADYKGKFPSSTREICILNQAAALSPLQHIKPVFVLIGGGIHPGMVPAQIATYGLDQVIGAGGGIHAHPKGPRAGGRAFRQAIDATMKGIPLEEAAKEHEELRMALDKWGYPKTEEEFLRVYVTRPR